MEKAEQYEVSVKSDYVELRAWGLMTKDVVQGAASAGLKALERHALVNLLCEISEASITGMSLALQTDIISILWQGRHLSKITYVTNDNEISHMLTETFDAFHMSEKYRCFDDRKSAIAWMRQK
jgi:hypothetical protein